MSGWFATLKVVAQMAFRNLFASRLKTIIVGGIIFFGALLVVAGNSLLDSLDASMKIGRPPDCCPEALNCLTRPSAASVTSNPAGINVAVGSSMQAPFTSGTSVILAVSNGRDAIWSGACSSGGSKRKTCTFTLNGTAAVTANVQ